MKPSETSGYSPVTVGDDGRFEVELDEDHPGFADPVYRARRNDLASLAARWQPGEPVPHADYTEAEHDVWRTVSDALVEQHERYAAAEILDAKEALGLPRDHVPQLSEVTSLLAGRSGFRYEPVPGLAPLREFYANFADGTFASTQYLRHPSVPLYTPEPDIVHEVIGHAHHLASPSIARLYRLMGEAVRRTQSQDALLFLSRVFWFTFEFGVVREHGEWKAYGAGILSSTGEIQKFREARIVPVDLEEMGSIAYDITHYQPVIYGFSSWAEVEDRLSELLLGYAA